MKLIEQASPIPTLIIVSGLPGSGKSTLAHRLAAHLAWPLIQKDMIKETLCDVLECTTLPQSQLYGQASIALLYQFASVILKSGASCIIESAFHPTLATQDLLSLQRQCAFSPLQIHCQAPLAVLTERVKQRWDSGERHRGHMEDLRKYYPHPSTPPEYMLPLPIDGQLIELDTTDFETVDYERLFARIRQALAI